jgi:uncharacterized ParB-like nuclease family protein
MSRWDNYHDEIVGKARKSAQSEKQRREIAESEGWRYISLSALQGQQPRAEMNQATVDDYCSAMAQGTEFPPITLYTEDDQTFYVADGWHRIHATQRGGHDGISAVVKSGNARDALTEALGANSTHGLPRSNADKWRTVEIALKDEEWGKWSARKIAELCKVSDTFVGKVRDKLQPKQDAITYTTKSGKTATMKTKNIGSKKSVDDDQPPVIKQATTTRPLLIWELGANDFYTPTDQVLPIGTVYQVKTGFTQKTKKEAIHLSYIRVDDAFYTIQTAHLTDGVKSSPDTDDQPLKPANIRSDERLDPVNSSGDTIPLLTVDPVEDASKPVNIRSEGLYEGLYNDKGTAAFYYTPEQMEVAQQRIRDLEQALAAAKQRITLLEAELAERHYEYE